MIIRPYVPPSQKKRPPMATQQTDMGWGSEYGPWTFTVLDESKLTSELTRLANAKSVGKVDSVSFQPCPNPDEASQDRHVILEWHLKGGIWKFTGVFDGHAGHETVDLVSMDLPHLIQSALASALDKHGEAISPEIVSELLSKSISDFDDSLKRGLEELFPGGPDAIAQLSDSEISMIVNDGGANALTVQRALRGSTALVCLVDPRDENVWVASLGDCQAVLGIKDRSGAWKSTLLSSNHNGRDPSEADRVRKEHPGEAECVLKDRILGSIAVSRALGDMHFKLPRIWSDRVFANTKPGIRMSSKLEDVLPRNLTPPYLSNKPDVQHVNLATSKGAERFIVMCSDGLIDLYDYSPLIEELGQKWVSVVGKGPTKPSYKNKALLLLRDGIGGDDLTKASRYLTVEMTEKWMDDTTVIVQTI